MKKQRHLHIQISTESEIGVIDLGNIELDEQKIKSVAEPKLVTALSQHFDCEVKIIFSHVKSVTPIEIVVDCIIKSEEEDRQESAILTETWVY